jgi:K+-sensing histidine kinase KdpD
MAFHPIALSEVTIDHLYEINRIVAQSAEWKPALDEISTLVRSIFIFDNLAVYISDNEAQNLDVMYAKAIGRGRSAGADVAWGEALANQILQTKKTTVLEPETDPSIDRLRRPFLLGIPLLIYERFLGVIIFIRFGGPPYSPENIQLGEFIANQIGLLVERQHLQENYELLEAQHRQARLQDDFISTISHELSTPIGFIKGYTTTLLRSDITWDQKTQIEFLRIIDQETDELEELIQNLLDSNRLMSGQMRMDFQLVRLDALMNDILQRARLHHPRLKVNVEISPRLLPVIADPRRLAQVFENLLNNAEKYAPNSPVDINIHQDEHNSYILVADHGPGISPQSISHIFDRFYRSPDRALNARGSGLGLFICRQIIQAHKGEISATSESGKGTTFQIVLPARSEAITALGGI